jgi:membrane protein YqaA with SNARE-associated domain
MAEVTLFFSAFLAATIFPFSSEATFIIALKNDMSLLSAMISASLGNVLAIVFNYYLGYFLYIKSKRKLFRSKFGKKSFEFTHKYGYFALLLSWLPLIGDPLTIVAGLLRLNFIYFLLIAGSLRVMRYYFLAVMV